jgi:ATP-dependent exoDNAse (exonuclease V) beta subunit
MSSPIRPAAPLKSLPPDQPQRNLALDSARSILVQAPAGSGKTDLLTRRFLRLLAEVDDPGQVVAITFTNAAAAEMRHRILAELERAAADSVHRDEPGDPFSMPALARRALDRSQALGWKLLDLPAQLRISTIDAFCRELALQQPLLSTLGGGLDVADHPAELYRRAARQTLKKIDPTGQPLSAAIEKLLLWRDNNWQELENLLVTMLGQRDRWMHDFVLDREPDWEALRERLERPFALATRAALTQLDQLFSQIPQAREQALQLARFACGLTGCHRELAEMAEFPTPPFSSGEELEEARQAYLNLAAFLLTGEGNFRQQIDKRLGFPADRKREKAELLNLIASLKTIPSLEAALAAVRDLSSARYTEEEWQIVRVCFTLLRHTAAQLQVVFADAGAVDFIEIAQIAQRVLRGPDGLPTDAALAIADKITHLLVDEFQDTSRRQHQLLASLIAAWPDRTSRTGFVVGDPMQSIYFFRDADAELFPRVKTLGLEIPRDEPLLFDFVPLSSNFRTARSLVMRLNQVFDQVFAELDGSGVTFSPAEPARKDASSPSSDPPDSFNLHLEFVPQTAPARSPTSQALDEKEAALDEKEAARTAQIKEIVDLIRSHQGYVDEARQARERGEDRKFRIAVLGRARNHLAPIAQALRQAGIPFRAVDLEALAVRPEVLDALSLARALLNSQDRSAWLGVLRAPWCGLSLEDLHRLCGGDDPASLLRSIPELLTERLPLLSEQGRLAVARILEALRFVPRLRAAQPTVSLGTWLQAVWLSLGGADCVDSTARANLDLLWNCLDRLPGGEQDLLGPALAAALAKLTALPDPSASSECGVQLMTIHKSKGLEFEVVIVPELQAATGRGRFELLSWLERGLKPDFGRGPFASSDGSGDSGEITEFLIAPLQPKGADRGTAKAWVDRVRRERESQETRRILYVAATRAREQLHLFARPACKAEDAGFALIEPHGSLLATAWPALEEEVRARFEVWKANRAAAQAGEESILESLAAAAESHLLIMPSPARPTPLRRLPQDYQPGAPGPSSETWESHSTLGAPSFPRLSAERVGDHESQSAITSPVTKNMGAPGLDSETWDSREGPLYPRHEGGLVSRALGTAVHSLLEDLARLRAHLDWDSARKALMRLEPRIAAQVRASGIDQSQAAKIAAQALAQALSASQNPIGAWILSPQPQAASELRWTSLHRGQLRTVQVDRLFRAGSQPQSEGVDHWWIVDYKTAHADNLDPAAALPPLRETFAPQLEAYAEVLRKLHGKEAKIRAGLYYPRMSQFDWWEL